MGSADFLSTVVKIVRKLKEVCSNFHLLNAHIVILAPHARTAIDRLVDRLTCAHGLPLSLCRTHTHTHTHTHTCTHTHAHTHMHTHAHTRTHTHTLSLALSLSLSLSLSGQPGHCLCVRPCAWRSRETLCPRRCGEARIRPAHHVPLLLWPACFACACNSMSS